MPVDSADITNDLERVKKPWRGKHISLDILQRVEMLSKSAFP